MIWRGTALISYKEDFLSSGPQNYAFSVFCNSTGKRAIKSKVMGITLTYENWKVINFTTLRDMILEDAQPANVHNPRKMKRKHVAVVVSEPEKRSTGMSLRNPRLWTTWTHFRVDINNVFIYVFIYLLRISTNRVVITHYISFHAMTLKLQHQFSLTVAGTISCGKSKFVIRLLRCREHICDILFENIVWCHNENNAPRLLKKYHFLNAYQNLITLNMYLRL